MNQSFRTGAKAAIPPCLGVIPVGISIGLLGVQTGLRVWETILMSALVMAGSSELLVIGMLGQGAAMSAMIVGTFFINLRHIVMSSSVMQRLQGTPLSRRLLGAFALCDESFAVFSMSEDHSFAFLMGANTALYSSFVLSTAVGSLLTGFLPQIVVDSFGIAFYAAFLGLLLPGIKHHSRLILLVLITALLNWGLQLLIPASWAIILAMVLGALIGVWLVEDETDKEEEAV